MPTSKYEETAKSDLEALQKEDSQTADNLVGSLDITTPERRADGSLIREIDPHNRRQFLYDAEGRQVAFRSVQRDGWHELSLPLGQTYDHMHALRFSWNEHRGYMGLMVDDMFKELSEGKIRTGKVGP